MEFKISKIVLCGALYLFGGGSLQVRADTCQELLHRGEPALYREDILKHQNIHFEAYGEFTPEKRVIVLVHGLGGSGRTWARIAPELAKDAYVIVPDTRGHGRTRYEGEHFSSSMVASDLASLVRGLGVGRVDLVGHSMGGRAVIRFAQLFPELTRSVVVEDMHMKGRSKLLPDNLDLARRLRALPKTFASEGEIYAALSPYFANDYIRDVIVEKFAIRGKDGQRLELTYDMSQEASYRLYESQGLQEDLTAPLKDAKAPLLFMAATRKDAVLFGIGVDHLKANRPDAQLVSLDAGHGIHKDAPAEFVLRLREFFSRN